MKRIPTIEVKMKTLSLITVFLLLSGCTSLMGPGDYSEYAGALKNHDDQKAASINSIMLAPSSASSEEGKAYEGASRVLAAAFISNNQLNIAKPTTGMDVLNNFVGQIPMVTMGTAMYRLGKIGIESAGNIAVGDNANISGMNKIENHATGSGTTANTSGTMPAAEPVIVPTQVIE